MTATDEIFEGVLSGYKEYDHPEPIEWLAIRRIAKILDRLVAAPQQDDGQLETTQCPCCHLPWHHYGGNCGSSSPSAVITTPSLPTATPAQYAIYQRRIPTEGDPMVYSWSLLSSPFTGAEADREIRHLWFTHDGWEFKKEGLISLATEPECRPTPAVQAPLPFVSVRDLTVADRILREFAYNAQRVLRVAEECRDVADVEAAYQTLVDGLRGILNLAHSLVRIPEDAPEAMPTHLQALERVHELEQELHDWNLIKDEPVVIGRLEVIRLAQERRGRRDACPEHGLAHTNDIGCSYPGCTFQVMP